MARPAGTSPYRCCCSIPTTPTTAARRLTTTLVQATDPDELLPQAQQKAATTWRAWRWSPTILPRYWDAKGTMPANRLFNKELTTGQRMEPDHDIIQRYISTARCRLMFEGIEADTPEAAALHRPATVEQRCRRHEDYNGEDLSALVDVAGDENYRNP